MNRPVRRVAVVLFGLALALLVRVTWLQAGESHSLAVNPHNERDAIDRYSRPLGDILVEGRPVTGSERTSGDLAYKRTYTDGKLYAPVTGYSSQLYGSTQLEALDQPLLDGTDPRLKSPLQEFGRTPARPGEVLTTIDPAVQKAAYRGLGASTGAAVALDPRTGAILAMASTPSYDPGTFSGESPADVRARQALLADPRTPTLNRALRDPLAPGSVFKLVVAAAALKDGLYPDVDTPTQSPDPYLPPRTTRYVTNEESSAPCRNASIRTALQYSCNTVFAKIAVQLGSARIAAEADRLGFNDPDVDTPVRAAESVYPSRMNAAQTALSGFGQFDDQATPLEMAMVVSAVADGGTLMKPYMVEETTDASGHALSKADPGPYGGSPAMSAATAGELCSAMRTVVEDGTGTNARIGGLTVGGKTGTAQNGDGNNGEPYAWFVSCARGPRGKEVAVAVLVQSSGAVRTDVSGNGQAAPIAAAMMRAALFG
ncbi:penicillin-binding transpeptidase domain-containing protein [Streptomyces sp. NBC_01264]|uniref:penicillin-binding transpeptidase domain-containing protein n=1 Tax=Streptomyces sp. NBC_01264 TaxID=2903804 RepID=UPI00224F8E82|nr:penicillin-binding transpeptidase domain-containing protein [Streptomyces sp. NBC_01264]MCX4781528.1 penicillin-binding transpeptidase domain-containing protein [Streptomyces sp. NBC_01264]